MNTQLLQSDAESAFTKGLASLEAQPLVAASAWADEHFYLSPESAAEPGRWSTLPYQREPLDAMTDPTIEQVTFMKSARIGYTKMLGAAVGSFMHQDPCPIGIVQPTIDDAKNYSKEEIAPMLRDCPVLAELVPESKTRDGDNSILHKRFHGGILSLIGANSGRGFRRTTRRVMAFDETDAYPLSAGTEGDPIKLGIRRTETFWNRKIILGSTPLLAGVSRIERSFLSGDQRRFYVPCTQCGEMAYLVFNEKTVDLNGEPVGHFMRWPKDRPEDAYFVCRTCGGDIAHRDKRAMVSAGEWRPHAPFRGHASFHLWAAYSFSPNATWGQIAAEFVEANAAGAEQLKTFVNTVLGETWKSRGEAPPWEVLYQRRAMYQIGTCPPGVLFLTVGVDVQKDALIYEVVGWGRGKRSWSIDAGIFPGETSDLTEKGPWPQVDALLAREYLTPSGVRIRSALLAVDSGFNTQQVYTWARRKPITQVIAIKGVEGRSALVGMPTVVELSRAGKKLKRGYKVWPVSGDVAKTELYGWLQLHPATDEMRAGGETDPPGYCAFPQYGEDFFKQLTGEQLVAHRNRQGFVEFTWELIPGRQNHALDCRVYARSAAAVVGLDRFQESDWRRLEQHQGVTAPVPLPVIAAPPVSQTVRQTPPDDRPAPPPEGGTAAPIPPARPPMHAKPKWMGHRRSNWLRGRR